jgi:hypothetical protein
MCSFIRLLHIIYVMYNIIVVILCIQLSIPDTILAGIGSLHYSEIFRVRYHDIKDKINNVAERTRFVTLTIKSL